MKNKGFSLVELIVVIAIMAILVGVAVPVYTSYIEKAQKSKDEQLVDEIKHAMQIAAIGENWADKYGISQDGTFIGAIVLKPNNGAAEVQQETVIGSAIDETLVATFGSDYKNKLTLSYDSWEGTLAGTNLDSFVGSSYYGNVPTLMGDIQSLTGALKLVLDDSTYTALLDGSFGTWLDGKVDKSNKQAVANAAILYVANGSSDVDSQTFLNAWKTPASGSMLGLAGQSGLTMISCAAAEYAKTSAAINWLECKKLQEEFSAATAGLGNTENVDDSTDLAALLSPLTTIIQNHFENCGSCWAKIEGVGFPQAYCNDTSICEKDAQAYLALLGQVSDSQDKVLSDITNPNLFAEETLVSYVNNYVNVANALSKLDVSENAVVIVFSMNANGGLSANAYPLDYNG